LQKELVKHCKFQRLFGINDTTPLLLAEGVLMVVLDRLERGISLQSGKTTIPSCGPPHSANALTTPVESCSAKWFLAANYSGRFL
jgi:hypothetical protein